MTNSNKPNHTSPLNLIPLAELKLIVRRISNAVLTLFVIAYLTSFVLILAERGRDRLPANPLDAAAQSLLRVWQFIFDHPQTYFWHKADISAFNLVLDTILKSAGLLSISLGVAFIVGVGLGITAAISKQKVFSSLIVVLSTLGVSTPSFILGMLFWMVNIQIHRTFGIDVLPSAGFGWDSHLVMPALALAMRPLAQISQVTYVSLTEILTKDYIRTAFSKGLSSRLVYIRHALTNVLIPILTTLGTSLRYSLASLPVVELFFSWPGVGLTLLQAIDKGMATFVTDLILSLGIFFLLINMLIEILFPLIDARLRSTEDEISTQEPSTNLSSLKSFYHGLRDWIRNIPNIFIRRATKMPPLVTMEKISGTSVYEPSERKGLIPLLPPSPVPVNKLEKIDSEPSRRRWFIPAVLNNPSLIIGTLLLLGLTGLAVAGGKLTSANPYATHGILSIEGTVWSAPFKPSSMFPWGSDYIGRDIQSLVLNGARQTLSLALFGTLARTLLGSLLGILAGWNRGGRLDRFISGAVGVWAAFPVTLFAMLVIQGLGIQQGLWVFVLAISVVGWGEVAQMVRSQVINIKLQPFIESARSTGARSDQILVRHFLPNLVNDLIVITALEMGGVMMLLAELGYLNIFLGGGFSAMIGEVGNAQPLIVRFSDVPEWAALIANVRAWWRSYPWMALYPGLAFFISIMAFTLTGEGLRRFLPESRMNLARLFNRYTVMAGISIVVVLSILLQANAPLGLYKPVGLAFDSQRIFQDIQVLSSPEFQGRESGTPGAELAAQYISKRMQENGLMPGGEKNTFLQTQIHSLGHLLGIPTLEIMGSGTSSYVYRRDFAEITGLNRGGEAQAPIIGVAFGALSNDENKDDPYGLLNTNTRDCIIVVHGKDYSNVSDGAALGILLIADDQYTIERKDLDPVQGPVWFRHRVPAMVISPQVADQILATAGSSIADLNKRAGTLGTNLVSFTNQGAVAHMNVDIRSYDDVTRDTYINVLGVIPGEGHFMGTESQVIMVSAYYDGLGTGPDGTLYPGANDNASGVAMLLELARVMKASLYKPEKTVIFAAWSGGERGDGLSVVNVLNARPGAESFTVEAVIELSGVGYGSGNSISLRDDSSYRLVKLFQAAASKYDDPVTTRGRNPHYGRGIASGFGDRRALTLSISWDGSDDLAHTPRDVPEIINPQKLISVGRSTLLTLMVLSRETKY